eukprot:5745016-Prymnesium_polylepis.1
MRASPAGVMSRVLAVDLRVENICICARTARDEKKIVLERYVPPRLSATPLRLVTHFHTSLRKIVFIWTRAALHTAALGRVGALRGRHTATTY